jgi:hypothetical protein
MGLGDLRSGLGGVTDPRRAEYAFQDFDGNIRSVGKIAATIDHELCHAKQAIGPSCMNYPKVTKTVGARWYEGCPTSQGCLMNELEAYDYVLSRLAYYGMTANEADEIRKERNIKHSYLTPENQLRACQHYYISVPGQEELGLWKTNEHPC